MATETPDLPEIACQYCAKDFDLQIPAECTLANGTPCPGCVHQIKLKARIEETKKLLDELIAEENQARTEINFYHDSFLRLPTEIHSHIFRFTLPDFELQGRTVDRDETHSEPGVLTLGAVCKRWRNIAWSTPRLWSNVMLVLSKDPTDNMIEVIQEWLQRSRELPLLIRLIFYNMSRGEDLQTLRFIGSFNEHSARWQDLSIRCENELFAHFCGNASSSSYHVKALQLITYSGGAPWPIFRVNGTMPQPDHITAMGFQVLNDIGVSWNNATSITLEGLELVDNIGLLRIASRLTELRLHNVGDSHHLDASVQIPLAHPHLRTLHISSSSVFAVALIMDTIALPSLEDLNIYGMGVIREGSALAGSLPLPSNDVMGFLKRSACSLISFTLEDIECEGQEFLEILSSLPSSVKILQLDIRLQNQGWESDLYLPVLFNYLSRSPSATGGISSRLNLLPNLERFKYHVFQATKIPWGLLSGIALPVLGQKRPLKELTIIERQPFFDFGQDYSDAESFMIARSGEISKNIIRDLIGLQDDGVDLCFPNKLSREFLVELLDDDDDSVQVLQEDE